MPKQFITIVLTLLSTIIPLAGAPDTPYPFDTVIAYQHVLDRDQQDLADLVYKSLSSYDYEVELPHPVSVECIDAVLENILNDYPELFHVGDSYAYYYAGPDESYGIEGISFTPAMGRDEAEATWAAMTAVHGQISEVMPLEWSDFEKELFIHDVLAQAIDYSIDEDEDYTPQGALLRGEAACEGYAEAFNLLLRLSGIPSSTVSGDADGGPHEWNIVNIDGVYSLVDLTWDDQDGYMSHTYFNITQEMMERDHEPYSYYEALPDALSLERNLHALSGSLYDEEADMSAVLDKLFTEASQDGNASVRFTSNAAYSAFIRTFDDNVQDWSKGHESISYSIANDDVQLVITILDFTIDT